MHEEDLPLAQQLATTSLTDVLTDCLDAQTEGQRLACEAALGPAAVTGLAITVAFIVASVIATVGVYRAALRVTQGYAPSFADLLTVDRLGRYVAVQLLSALIIGIGILLCVLPGLVAGLFLQFAPLVVLDRAARPLEAMAESARMVRRHLGPSLITGLLTVVVLLLGGALWGLLTLVALPFAALFVSHMYRQLREEPVTGPLA